MHMCTLQCAASWQASSWGKRPPIKQYVIACMPASSAGHMFHGGRRADARSLLMGHRKCSDSESGALMGQACQLPHAESPGDPQQGMTHVMLLQDHHRLPSAPSSLSMPPPASQLEGGAICWPKQVRLCHDRLMARRAPFNSIS